MLKFIYKSLQKSLHYMVLLVVLGVFLGAIQVNAQKMETADNAFWAPETKEVGPETTKNPKEEEVETTKTPPPERKEVESVIMDSGFLSGTLKEIIMEGSEDSKREEAETIYVIDSKEYGLVMFNSKEDLKYPNAYIEVKGFWNDDKSFYVEDVLNIKKEETQSTIRPEAETLGRDGEPIKSETFGPPPTTGGHSVLFILANFTNDISQPISQTQIRDTIYNNIDSANKYFLNVSKQRFWLKGLGRPDLDIVNWTTLPLTNDGCESNLMSTWTNAAEANARAQGFEPNNYTEVILIFPKMQNCTLPTAQATIGTIGGSSFTNRVWFLYSPTSMTLPIFNRIFIHELGHNLGLQHANAVKNCQPVNISSPNIFPQGCQEFEGGDSFTLMGTSSQLRHFNNFHLYQLGWLGGQAKVGILPQIGTYSFNLMPPTAVTKGYQVVTFPLKNASGVPTGQSAYLEFRKHALPFENITNDPNQNVTVGTSIRFAQTDLFSQEKTYLFDFHEATSFLADAAIGVGETYQNSTYGFSLTTTSISPQRGARFTLQLNQ